MGVPVVTLCDDRHAGRMSASILTCVGLDEWITRTGSEYLAVAAKAASSLEHLAAVRAELRDRMRNSSLCDASTFVQRLEAAYRMLWREWCTRAQGPRSEVEAV
jgi:predicted O-linked N-acetylglucosamine transferase (SPINDLY family)